MIGEVLEFSPLLVRLGDFGALEQTHGGRGLHECTNTMSLAPWLIFLCRTLAQDSSGVSLFLRTSPLHIPYIMLEHTT
jgi:hypothetical protein